MKWRGRERSSNIEDRRTSRGGMGGLGGLGGAGRGGFNPFGRGGGIGIPSGRGGLGGVVGIVVVLGILWLVSGQNPLDILTGNTTTTTQGPASSSAPPTNADQDDLAGFVGVVVKETENLWTEVFEQNNMTYVPPSVVLFTSRTQSGCGVAEASSGPFYCPNDQKVYIDLAFYNQLRQQFGAPGDFAQAYVIAHEIGHHVQNLTGVLPEFNARRGAMSQDEQNAYSVRVELQADCYAGVWANYAQRENLLEAGDVEEAINAANAIGDDTLTRGQVAPRNFTHGTSEQRRSWLQRGMDTGDVSKCDAMTGQLM